MIKTLEISEIISDMSVNPRGEINHTVVERYSEIIDTMPPLDVFEVSGQGFILSSGFHRREAHILMGRTKARCKVHAGTLQNAIEFADKSNAKNPLQLSVNELIGLCERALARSPSMGEKEMAKMYGVSRRMIRDVKKRLNWDNNAFPSIQDQDDYDVIPSVDPRLKERHWSRLHFENPRRSATLYERLTPCELCGYPISQRCHLLDVSAWGDNEFTRAYCVRCHEMFDLIITNIESKKKTRADVLIKLFEWESGEVSEDLQKWFAKIKVVATRAAEFRKLFLEERDAQREHHRKHRDRISELMDEAKTMGVR